MKNQQNVQRVSLSKEKVVNLVKDVFISAAERDIYTGDAVVVHVITKDGTTTERFPLRRDWKLLLYDIKDSTFSAMWMYSICKWLNEPFFSLHLFHWQVKTWLITSLNFVTLKFFNKWIVFFTLYKNSVKEWKLKRGGGADKYILVCYHSLYLKINAVLDCILSTGRRKTHQLVSWCILVRSYTFIVI